jgi:RNA polymerase sigma-70 factor, ECF subfamily
MDRTSDDRDHQGEEVLTAPPADHPSLTPDQVELFVRLLAQNQCRIVVYVMSMVPNWSDAEEIIQETNLVLWREFGQFRPGTNFTAWAYRIALNRVLTWRRRKRRERLEFSDTFVEAVADLSAAEADRLAERSRALALCIEKLPAKHRLLLELRYKQGRDTAAMARELGRSVGAVLRTLSRIRHVLQDCVTHSLMRDDLS